MWVAMVVLLVLLVFTVVLVLLRIPNCVVLGGVGGKILMLGVKTAVLSEMTLGPLVMVVNLVEKPCNLQSPTCPSRVHADCVESVESVRSLCGLCGVRPCNNQN